MTFDLQQILASKQAFRRRLANLPIGEKLRMLDALRERELAIRGGGALVEPVSSVLREDPAPYRVRKP